MEITITAYSFNPSAGTVTFTNFTTVDPARVAAIYDESVPTEGQEFGSVMYLAENAPQASAAGNVLTLPVGSIPIRAASTDTLKISYNVDAPDGWQRLVFPNSSAFPVTGASDFLYLAANTGQLYEWDGTAFVAV